MRYGSIKVIVIAMINTVLILENKENQEWDLDYSKHLSPYPVLQRSCNHKSPKRITKSAELPRTLEFTNIKAFWGFFLVFEIAQVKKYFF